MSRYVLALIVFGVLMFGFAAGSKAVEPLQTPPHPVATVIFSATPVRTVAKKILLRFHDRAAARVASVQTATPKAAECQGENCPLPKKE